MSGSAGSLVGTSAWNVPARESGSVLAVLSSALKSQKNMKCEKFAR